MAIKLLKVKRPRFPRVTVRHQHAARVHNHASRVHNHERRIRRGRFGRGSSSM